MLANGPQLSEKQVKALLQSTTASIRAYLKDPSILNRHSSRQKREARPFTS